MASLSHVHMTKGKDALRVLFIGRSNNKPQFEYDFCNILDPSSLENGEILGRIRLATICGSDLHTILGRRLADTPLVLGHEGVAEVVYYKQSNAAGAGDNAGRSALQVGDRFVFSMVTSCQQCDMCTHRNLPQKCAQVVRCGHTGISGGRHGWTGCYASHIIIPAKCHIVKIQDSIPDSIAAPIGCALATAFSALWPYWQSKEEMASASIKGKSAWVQGAGLVGTYCCVLLHELGYSPVYCSDVNADRLQLVSQFGATPVNLLTGTGGSGGGGGGTLPTNGSIDVVVEASGHKSVFTSGVACVRVGGEYVLIGSVHGDSRTDIDLDQVVLKCITIRGVHNYGDEHLTSAVRFMQDTVHKYPYESLISGDVYDLTDLESAVIEAIKGPYHRIPVKYNAIPHS